MKFICLGFYDEKKFASLSPEEGLRMMKECFAYDNQLRRDGHFVGGEALSSAASAVTLRTRDGKVEAIDGPFIETKEVLGGILLLEARDMSHAISLMSQHPGVKMGPFEIRPANEEVGRLCAEWSTAESLPSAALSTERVFSATPRQLFAAFEQPEQLTEWWGPNGFTSTFEQFDFQPGGRWVFMMHGPNGANYPNECIFRETRPHAKIVIEHVANPWFLLTVTLTPRGDQTHLAWVQEFENPTVAEKISNLIGNSNEQVLDRLEALLAKQPR